MSQSLIFPRSLKLLIIRIMQGHISLNNKLLPYEKQNYHYVDLIYDDRL